MSLLKEAADDMMSYVLPCVWKYQQQDREERKIPGTSTWHVEQTTVSFSESQQSLNKERNKNQQQTDEMEIKHINNQAAAAAPKEHHIKDINIRAF